MVNAHVPFVDCWPGLTDLDKLRRTGEGLDGGPLQKPCQRGAGLTAPSPNGGLIYVWQNVIRSWDA